MKYIILFGGPNVGKTGAVTRFAGYLSTKGYSKSSNQDAGGDIVALFENDVSQINGNNRVVVFGCSDYLWASDWLKQFCEENKPFDLVVMACRSEKEIYESFKEKLAISENDTVVEIPLGKVNYRYEEKWEYGKALFEKNIDWLVQYFFEHL